MDRMGLAKIQIDIIPLVMVYGFVILEYQSLVPS
jgi:hypothetical protein